MILGAAIWQSGQRLAVMLLMSAGICMFLWMLELFLLPQAAEGFHIGGLSTHPLAVVLLLLVTYVLLHDDRHHTPADTRRCSALEVASLALWLLCCGIVALVLHSNALHSEFFLVFARMLLWGGGVLFAGRIFILQCAEWKWPVVWASLVSLYMLLGVAQEYALPFFRSPIVHIIGFTLPGVYPQPSLGLLHAADATVRIDSTCLGLNLLFLSVVLVSYCSSGEWKRKNMLFAFAVVAGSLLCNLLRIWLVTLAALILPPLSLGAVHTVLGMVLSAAYLFGAVLLHFKMPSPTFSPLRA